MVPTALAAPPRFDGPPVAVAFARAAWDAGVECMGGEPPHHDEIRIEAGWVAGGFAGTARLDGRGLASIDVQSDFNWYTVSHEVAHAWTSGPVAYEEGTTELLGDCISARLSNPHGLDKGDPATFDLLDWANASDAESEERTNGYVQARRLAQSLNTVVPLRALVDASGSDWPTTLRRLSEEYAVLKEPLDWWAAGTSNDRMMALSDPDRDGMPCLGEWIIGTNPSQWDSDGDGWWDGARPGAGVPVRGGELICAVDDQDVDDTQAFLGNWKMTLSRRRTHDGWFGELPAVAGGFSVDPPRDCARVDGIWVKSGDLAFGTRVARTVSRLQTEAGATPIRALDVRPGLELTYWYGRASAPKEMVERATSGRGGADMLAALLVAYAMLGDHPNADAVEAYALELLGRRKPDEPLWYALDDEGLNAAREARAWRQSSLDAGATLGDACPVPAPWIARER